MGDTVIAFRKAAVALITSWLVGELEVHATLGMLGVSMVLNVLGNPYTDLEVDGNKKQMNRGQNLMQLDTVANFITFLTAWSGLFFILYPHCEHNTAWCVAMVSVVACINVAFFMFCVFIFFKEKYRESMFEILDGLRKMKRRLPCLRCCITVEDKPGFREVSLRLKHDEAKKLRERSQSNPLKYRKSFVKESSTVNPMMLVDDAIGDIEMIQNPLDQSTSKRSKRFGRKRGRTVSIIDTLKDEMSQQTIRFKSVVSKSKRLKELSAKVRLQKSKKKGHIGFGLGSSKKEQAGKQEACTHIDIGGGWFKATIGVGKKIIYFNSETGSVNDTNPFGLKSGYVMLLDDVTGNFYYVNEQTGDTTWERPERDGKD